MCILSYLSPGVDVDEDGLMNGGISNPHGHGWAITAGDHIQMGKSLDIVEALEGFSAARKANPGGHALFHSRWATHGSVSTANVHPFNVGRQSGLTVVGHNGILPAAAHPAKGDDRSDTRLFADEILSTRYRRLDKKRAMTALADWIGSYNKLVVLTVHPRYRSNAYIVNESAGNWDSATGLWHSNFDYLDQPKYTAKWYSDYTRDLRAVGGKAKGKANANGGDWQDCAFCYYGNVDDSGYCDECESCADCYEAIGDCQCIVTGDLRDHVDPDMRADDPERLQALISADDVWLAELAREQGDSQHDYS